MEVQERGRMEAGEEKKSRRRRGLTLCRRLAQLTPRRGGVCKTKIGHVAFAASLR